MADRDPDTIKQEIDQARDQLALTVDSLSERASPRRIADDVKSGLVRVGQETAGGDFARRYRGAAGGAVHPQDQALISGCSTATPVP